jgi:hypothetical protein
MDLLKGKGQIIVNIKEADSREYLKNECSEIIWP